MSRSLGTNSVGLSALAQPPFVAAAGLWFKRLLRIPLSLVEEYNEHTRAGAEQLIHLSTPHALKKKMADPKTITVSPEDATVFVEAILQGAGVSKANAETIAHGLVSADLRGVESHGINRIPSYLARVRSGILDPKAEPTLNQVTPVVAQVSHPGSSSNYFSIVSPFGFILSNASMRTNYLSIG